MGPVALRAAERADRAGAGVELLQPALQRRRFRQLLHRVAHHGRHVAGLEVAEGDEGREL